MLDKYAAPSEKLSSNTEVYPRPGLQLPQTAREDAADVEGKTHDVVQDRDADFRRRLLDQAHPSIHAPQWLGTASAPSGPAAREARVQQLQQRDAAARRNFDPSNPDQLGSRGQRLAAEGNELSSSPKDSPSERPHAKPEIPAGSSQTMESSKTSRRVSSEGSTATGASAFKAVKVQTTSTTGSIPSTQSAVPSSSRAASAFQMPARDTVRTSTAQPMAKLAPSASRARPSGTTPAARTAQFLAAQVSRAKGQNSPVTPPIPAPMHTGAKKPISANPTAIATPNPTKQDSHPFGKGQPVDSAAAFAGLLKSFQAGHGPRFSTARLQLRPAELGRLTVDVKLRDRKLAVDMRVESESARELLGQHVRDLRDALEQHGLTIERFTLNVQDSARDSSETGLDGRLTGEGHSQGSPQGRDDDKSTQRIGVPQIHGTHARSHDETSGSDLDRVAGSVAERRLDMRV